MSVKMGFKPLETISRASIAQRLRVCAAVNSGVLLSSDEARLIARELEAKRAMDPASVHTAALQMLADQEKALSAELDAKRAELNRNLRQLILPLLAACVMAALIIWGR